MLSKGDEKMREQVTINERVYDLVSGYKEDESLRESFFALAKKTFKINFKEWYEAGYWGDGYRPYSLVHKGEIVANVSVSISDFMFKGKKKHWVQLGCVAVEANYRKQGLARFLIEYVMKQYERSSEGIFLFGNDRVLDFYPKFGFHKADEYEYSKRVINERNIIKSRLGLQRNHGAESSFKETEQLERNYHYRKLDHTNEEDIRLVADKTKQYYRDELLAALDNTNLIMFYWQGFLSDCLYYIDALDTIVIYNIEKDVLHIEEVFGEAELEEVVAALVKDDIKEVVLGFVPKAQGEYEIGLYHEEDTTLFVSTKEMKELMEGEKLMFPVLSHT